MKVTCLRRFPWVLSTTLVMLAGCAEGPLWQTGKYAPWTRNQWAAEEKIANTIFTRKTELNEMVAAAQMGGPEQKERAANELAGIIQRDPVLLMRLHAVRLLGDLDGPSTISALQLASRDHNPDVRIAAIGSWTQHPGEVAIGPLQEIVGSDTNIDVRLAATRALGNFHGSQAVAALALALETDDPALQIRATESLRRVTGENIGRDVAAWKRYVGQSLPNHVAAGSQTSDRR